MENTNITKATRAEINQEYVKLQFLRDCYQKGTRDVTLSEINKLTAHIKGLIVESSDYRLHHGASRRGYLSRKGAGSIELYAGRFGTGYILTSPRWDTTQYVDVYYYILNN